ncbi:MAG: Uncharacterized protein FD161_840 [Limisphaerales bacterium]|nr:MAG: Uncharacterized protein FD161_840 [Limisphaerales bacterium]KAG0509999.1 MAG: Uncharacterized protein E1N63_840 [Limisphaerales bacterium]TXT53111.1 MAG: Uncharacterized protein FD140_219 [Limisphaerales bacterium]
MDTSFNCPKCNLHITADECVVGEEIDCPECGEKFRVPPPKKPKPVPVIVKSAAPLATPAAHDPPVLHAAPAHPAPGHAAPEAAKDATGEPPKPAAHAPEHKPLSVPHRSGPQESLIKKTAHTEHKDEPPKIRVKTIKRGSCVEVGHDLFDEKVTEFLNKIGQENIINISPIGYGAMDSTGHMLPDYGIMIVYKG